MATSTELSRTQIVTRTGVVTAVVVDRVSPDRLFLSLVKGAASAQYARTLDLTPLVDKAVKGTIIFPSGP